MTRLATVIDRIAALIFGFALLALGFGLLVWNTYLIPGTPDLITAPGLVSVVDNPWWPWAVAAFGIVLVVLAVRWLVAHTPKQRIKSLRIEAGDLGSVSADLGEVADAAARALQQSPDVRAASGKAVIDRGQRTIDLEATAYSPTTVASLIESIDAVSGQLSGVLGDTTIFSRTCIRIGKHSRGARVE